VAKETSNSESLACVEECLRKKFDHDVEYYKDQICRLEATIAAHQERLGRVLKASRRASAKPCQQQGIILYYASRPSNKSVCLYYTDRRPRNAVYIKTSCNLRAKRTKLKKESYKLSK